MVPPYVGLIKRRDVKETVKRYKWNLPLKCFTEGKEKMPPLHRDDLSFLMCTPGFILRGSLESSLQPEVLLTDFCNIL